MGRGTEAGTEKDLQQKTGTLLNQEKLLLSINSRLVVAVLLLFCVKAHPCGCAQTITIAAGRLCLWGCDCALKHYAGPNFVDLVDSNRRNSD